MVVTEAMSADSLEIQLLCFILEITVGRKS
jgi:hypothetical protein